jgi:DNA-binding SARP family transcriptional activator/DNA-binding beta-propeller fold protein YncE
LDYRILGSLEVCHDGVDVALAGERQRVLLAILLLHANEVVSADAMIDAVWGERPPASALNAVHVAVSRLRRALGMNGDGGSDGLLATRGRGYVLRVERGELDVERFRGLLEQGREELAAGDPKRAAGTLRSALAVWRGAPLADFVYEPFAQPAIAELGELRLAALEERFEADLALGANGELVGEISAAVGRNPLRERLRAQLMLALYRCGRQAEALDLYQEFRRTLSGELGLEPGPGLRQLELAILERDPALDLPAGTAASHPPSVGSSPPHGKAARDDRRGLVPTLAGVALLTLLVAVVWIGSSGGTTTQSIRSNSFGSIDPSSGRITNVEDVGGPPVAIAVGDGTVWVADSNSEVWALNLASCDCEMIPTRGTPRGIAFGAGSIWVTDASNASVDRIDPIAKGIVNPSIPVGRDPTGVAVGDGSVWVANSGDGTLSRIAVAMSAKPVPILLGGSPTGVAVAADGVWVSDRAGGRVFRIDPQTDSVSGSATVGTGPTAVAAGFGYIWVTNSLDGTVSRIDPTTNAVDTVAVGDGVGAIAIAPDAVWVASQYAGTVSKIDPTSLAVLKRFKVANRVAGLAFSDGVLWAGSLPASARHRGGTLTVLSRIWVDTFDPALTHSAGGALDLTNDGLTRYERVGRSRSTHVVPDLAVSLPTQTDGGTTYTFRLRPGIRYSNGELVRPEDFRRAVERDLILGANGADGSSFANVVGGAECAANPSHCDLSRGVETDDIVDAVTFHLVAPDPEFLAQLTDADAVAVPAGTANRNIGLHPLAATGPYMWASVTSNHATLVRNPYFHEWSRAARPDGYPDRIVFRRAATQAPGLGNYQPSFQQDMLWDQHWVR